MSMQVIAPLVAIDTPQLIANSVPETVPLWDIGTAYNIGDQVRMDTTHKVYACLIANTGENPATGVASPPKWKATGPTNPWAMFDQIANTQTIANQIISVTIAPAQNISGLNLSGLKGKQVDISITSGAGGPVVFAKTIKLDGSKVKDAWSYWFAPFVQKTDVVVTKIPPYKNAQITVTVTGGGTVAIGAIDVGFVRTYGQMRFGQQASLVSYSYVDTDTATGITTFIKKPGAVKNQYSVRVPKSDAEMVWNQLKLLDAQLGVFIGTDDDELPMFAVRGFCKSANLVVPYPTEVLYDFELQSVT